MSHINSLGPNDRSRRTRRVLLALGVVVLVSMGVSLAYFVGYAFGWGAAINDTVGFAWGDHSSGQLKAFYGARSFIASESNGTLTVRGEIEISRSGGSVRYVHDAGVLGTASSHADAVAKWGTIVWTDSGCTFGAGGPSPVLVSRSVLESHR